MIFIAFDFLVSRVVRRAAMTLRMSTFIMFKVMTSVIESCMSGDMIKFAIVGEGATLLGDVAMIRKI